MAAGKREIGAVDASGTKRESSGLIMSVSQHSVIRWFTTPDRLRELAGEMEKFWKSRKLGQDTTVAIEYGKETELRILVDQDRIKSPVAL